MGDQEVESFSGSHADLESAADHLFTSPPRPQPLAFEALSLKTPAKSVPPTPDTALQQKVKIESKLEQSLGSRLDIQLEQKMVFYCVNTSYPMDNYLPVGATGPAKRQKKTSCIYYRQDR